MPNVASGRAGFLPRIWGPIEAIGRITIGVRLLMVILSAVLVLPGFVFLASLAASVERERGEMVEAMGLGAIEDLSDRLDSEIAVGIALLDVFSRSGWLEADELELMHRRARAALTDKELNLIVLDEAGRQLLNTRVAFGTPLGKSSDPRALAAAQGESVPQVSNFFFGRVAQAQVFNVLKPVQFPDGRRRVLILTRNIDSLFPVAAKTVTGGWTVELRDGNGVVGIRSGIQAESAAGSPCADTSAPREPGLVAFEGSLRLADWTVCAWSNSSVDVGVVPLRTSMFLLGGIVWLALALAVATLLGRILSRDIRQTARLASGLLQGDPGEGQTSRIREIADIRQSLRKVAGRLSDRESERRIILAETAHRARNQMALAISLVNLSARTSETVAEMKSALVQRLISLNRAVEVEESSKHGRLSLRTVIEKQLGAFIGDELDKVSFTGDFLAVESKAAQSLALVFHELATNAHKYGAWSVSGGHVAISWRIEDEDAVLVWAESGKPAEESERSGFGSTLLRSIVDKGFGGSIERDFRTTGLVCTLTVPLDALRG